LFCSAADWPTDPVWTGKMKITAKGRDAMIILHDDQGAVFAKCPFGDGAVEKGPTFSSSSLIFLNIIC
jgi:hypothetical protein